MHRMTSLSGRGMALLRDPETGRFLGISLLVGIGVGVGAWLLIVALEAVMAAFQWIDDAWFDGARWFAIITVPVGITTAWWLARRFAPEVSGDGVPETITALAVQGGHMRARSVPLKIVATALTLGSGGSGGREGPIVQIGGAIGSSIARRFGLGEDQVRSLLAAGAAAGIGAAFNAPIAGMMFALEVILGSFAVRHMSAVVLASVAAAVTTSELAREGEILRGSAYSLGDPRELVLYAGLAIVAVVAAYGFLRLLDVVEVLSHRSARPAWLRPVGLGLGVGVLGAIEPRLLGTGQQFVGEMLQVHVFEEGTGVTAMAAQVLVLLALGKIVATALTVATGGSGGAFMPSLFIGATLGAGFAKLVQPVWGVSELFPGAFAVVGMATVFSAVARAPLTAILIVFEITGARDYGLVLPLMLSAAFASFVADRVHPESVYTLPLKRRGISLVRSGGIDLLDTVTVGDVMRPPRAVAHPRMTLPEVQAVMRKVRAHGLAVVEEGRGLVGIITVSDIDRSDDPDATVEEVMTSRPVTVGPRSPVSFALERMAVLGVGRLPVVAEHDASELIGMFLRENAIDAYHLALGAATSTQMVGDRLRQRTAPGTEYFDFRVASGSMADRAEVRNVDWAGCTLISVRRGTRVFIPTGTTELFPGDVVTAYGEESCKKILFAMLNEGADEPTGELSAEEMSEVLFDQSRRGRPDRE